MEGGNRVVALPMRQKGEIIGAMVLEFSSDQKPTDHETTGLAVATEMLGPILADRHANDRYLITKAGISTRDTWKMLVGPKYWLAKLCVVVGLIGLWAVSGGIVPYWHAPYYTGLVMPTYKVRAPFHFASVEKRIVSVPFDQARLYEIAKRPGTEQVLQPGDDVEAGQVLARFDTHDIELKKIEAEARVARFDIEAKKLMAERDNGGKDQTAEAMSAMKQRDAAQAEASLAASQIERASVKAPISGRIMSGDLRDKVSSTMKQGEPLFEIALPGKLRVEIDLNERDVQRVRDLANGKGASMGEIKTNSQPNVSNPIIVDRIVPSEQPKEGQNTFTVYAHVDESKADMNVAKDWSPGQRGEAAIFDEPSTLMYQWTHRLVDWARLKLWIF